MSQNTKHLLLFLGGVATGAAVGLLFAPDSGRNTRDRLKDQLDFYLNKLSRIAARGEKVVEGMKEKFDDLNAEDHHRAKELLSEVEDLLSEIRAKS